MFARTLLSINQGVKRGSSLAPALQGKQTANCQPPSAPSETRLEAAFPQSGFARVSIAESHITQHLEEYWKHVPVDHITIDKVKVWAWEKRRAGLSWVTIKNILRTMQRVLTFHLNRKKHPPFSLADLDIRYSGEIPLAEVQAAFTRLNGPRIVVSENEENRRVALKALFYWSGRWESNPRPKLEWLRYGHRTTRALTTGFVAAHQLNNIPIIPILVLEERLRAGHPVDPTASAALQRTVLV